MADIYQTTPGSAVADTVQQILQRNREQQRQAVMDRLGLEKYRSDEANQAAQLGLEKQRTDASVAASNETINSELLKRLPRGRIPTENIKDPRVLDLIQKYGLTEEETDQETPTINPELAAQDRLRRMGVQVDGKPISFAEPPAVESVGKAKDEVPVFRASATRPPRTMYIGSNDFQKERDARDQMDAYIAAHPNEDPDTLRAIMMARAGMIDSLPANIAGARPSVTPILPTGRAGQRVDLPRGGSAMELGYPPQPNAASLQKLWQLENKSTGETKSFVGMPADVKPYTDAGWIVRQGNEAAVKPTPVVDPRFVLALTGVLRSNIPKAQKEAAFNQAKVAIVSSANTTPEVKEWLAAFMDNMKQRTEAGVPLPVYADAIRIAETEIEGISDAERNALASTIQLLLGQTP